MASNLRVDTILPSTGTTLGIGTAGGTINFLGDSQINTTGVITATSFSGSGANLTNLPVPTTITVADESSDTTCNPLFVTTTSGNLAPKTGTNLTFNSATGNLRAGSLFVGTGTDESKTQDGLILERNSGDGEVHITAGRTGGNFGGMQFYVAGGSGVTKRHQMIYDGSFRWYGADGTTERMRLLSGGSLLIGRTTATSFGSLLQLKSIDVETDGDTTGMRFNRTDSNAAWVAMRFYVQGNQQGYIQVNTSSTTYSTSSDYRLKENVVSISDGITRLKQLKPYRFNFKNDSSTTLDGFYAHEASEVVPESVVGTKDAVDSEGNIDPQGIDQSKLVPLLTAALQEAVTKIETLESKVATLEGS